MQYCKNCSVSFFCICGNLQVFTRVLEFALSLNAFMLVHVTANAKEIN